MSCACCSGLALKRMWGQLRRLGAAECTPALLMFAAALHRGGTVVLIHTMQQTEKVKRVRRWA